MNEIETGSQHAAVGLLIIWIRISTCYANTFQLVIPIPYYIVYSSKIPIYME